jgi:predicted phosphodiesterase
MDDYIVIEVDDFIVISDIEIPDHDPAMLQAVLLTAMAKGIKTLIIAGDYLATDNATLNSWTETWAMGNQISYEGALALAVEILAKFVDFFDAIHVIQGNHDDRISRATGGEVWFGMLLDRAKLKAEGKCEIRFSRYSYLSVRTRRGTMAIYHQHNFSKTPVKLAQEMYAKENGPDYDPADLNPKTEKCHIVVTHCHLAQKGWSPDGLRECIALGTLRDPVRTRYAAQTPLPSSPY